MFGTIRKHSTVLWIVVITLTIISFVIFFTPDVGRQGGGSDRGELGTINGRPITQEEYGEAFREAIIQFGNEQQARTRGVNLQQAAIERLMVRAKIEEMNVRVSEKALAAFITSMPSFRDRQSGTFRKDMYDAFLQRLMAENGVREEDFHRFLRTELGIQRLQELFGQAGRLMTPGEAEELFRQENEQCVVELVAFTPFDFVGKVQTASSNLSQFYSNRLALYRLPERLVVNFVKFDFTNYTAEADAEMAKLTNLTARIDAVYNARGPAAYTDTNNQPLPAAQAKEKIKTEYREELATVSARKAANAFALTLDELKSPKPENLITLADERKLQVFESKPFSEFDTPPGLEVMENFSRQAFTLSAEEPFRGPIQGADAFFVISLKRKLPSEIPAMESILQRVMDDYRSEESMRQARQAGEDFAAKVQAGLQAGKTFDKLCAESKVTARSVPPFALSSRAVDGLDRSVGLVDLQNVVQSLSPGQASKFSPTREGGFVVFVKSRLPAAEDKVKEELPQFLTEMRQMRQRQAFQEWFRRSLETVRVSGRLATAGRN